MSRIDINFKHRNMKLQPLGELKTFYTRDEELLTLERTGDYKLYLYDGQGSVRALVNATGEITDTYWYDGLKIMEL